MRKENPGKECVVENLHKPVDDTEHQKEEHRTRYSHTHTLEHPTRQMRNLRREEAHYL